MAELAATLVATEADRLSQAEASVRSYCGWHIAPSRTETFTVTAPRSLWGATYCRQSLILPSLHVTAVDSVTVDGVAVDPADYTWTPYGTIEGRWSGQQVVVTFTHGYATPPADVTGAVQALAQSAIDNPTGAKSYSTTDGPFANSATFGAGTGASASSQAAVLDHYRLPALA